MRQRCGACWLLWLRVAPQPPRLQGTSNNTAGCQSLLAPGQHECAHPQQPAARCWGSGLPLCWGLKASSSCQQGDLGTACRRVSSCCNPAGPCGVVLGRCLEAGIPSPARGLARQQYTVERSGMLLSSGGSVDGSVGARAALDFISCAVPTDAVLHRCRPAAGPACEPLGSCCCSHARLEAAASRGPGLQFGASRRFERAGGCLSPHMFCYCNCAGMLWWPSCSSGGLSAAVLAGARWPGKGLHTSGASDVAHECHSRPATPWRDCVPLACCAC